MKKSLFLLSFLTFSVCAMIAGTIRKPGLIVLRPIRVIDVRPTITPLTDTVDPFVLNSTEDELVLSSEDASGDVTVTIAGENGVVYSTTETMSVGSELTISVSSLPAGAYTIYIYYANTVYVGQFEM